MEQQNARPNIVLILTDDMGFSDIGCFGSEIRTPHLDGLGERGIRFTQMYNGARCCPARASLLTGLHPHQAGIGQMTLDLGLPSYQGYLTPASATIAEVLRARGYRTLMSGKWHVGGNYRALDPESWKATAGNATHPTPTQRGFDRFFGILNGLGSFYDPVTLMDQDRFIRADSPDFYMTDAITDHAVDMVREAAGSPFFLYLAYTAPHWPLHARQEDVARYEGLYRRGWDAVRTARHEELKARKLVDPRWPISPRDRDAPAWEQVEDRDWEALRMAVYAAQVDRGLFKHWIHEGGISTPCIVSWPAAIAQPAIAHQAAQLVDITATIAEAAGATWPSERAGHRVPAPEGESFLPLLTGGAWRKQKPLFWEHEGNRAVRIGSLKLVAGYGGDWELYDMDQDRTELQDLSARNPDRVREMSMLYQEWAARCGVRAWPVRAGETVLRMRGEHIHLSYHRGRKFYP